MMKPSHKENRLPRRSVAMLVGIAVAVLLLAACGPTYSARPPGGYYGGQQGGYYGSGRQCYQGCGYVRDIRQVQLRRNNNGATLGTVIGALVGGALGNQVGKGDGRKAATVAGAVAGGFAGHAIGERSGREDYGWQIAVQLNNGQYATVTQRDPPQVRIGDYVMIRDNEIYHY